MEKQSRGKHAPKTVEVDGKTYELPPDLNDLDEIDYDDPEVKKWLEENERESIRLYGRMTVDEVEYIRGRRSVLQKVFPEKSNVELNQMALEEFRRSDVRK